MNKKKLVVLIASIVMICTLAIGGTLAYFMDTDYDKNVMTVGNIDIEQIEQFEQNADLRPAKDGELAVDKKVTIKNNGSVDAYVRTLFAFEDTRDLCTAVHYNSNYYDQFVFPSNNTDNWLQIKRNDGTVFTVGYLVYPAELEAGATTDEILSAIWLDDTATNAWSEVAGSEYEVLVLTQAIQTEGFDSADEAFKAEATFGAITMDSDATVAEWFTQASAEGESFVAYNYVNNPWFATTQG